MLDGLNATAYAIAKTLAISVPTVLDAVTGRLTRERADERLHDWASGVIEHAGVQLTVSGWENVPRDRACVFMSNHQSHFDIPIIYVAFPGTLRMVAKAELFRVPIWGRAMRAAGFVSVDRSGNRDQAMAAMRVCGEAIRSGVNIWIAPEGTRSLDGRIGKFKKGGFLLAQETETEIVPMAIDGSRDILQKHSLRVQHGVPVTVTYGPPLVATGRPVDELVGEVRSFIKKHVTEPTE